MPAAPARAPALSPWTIFLLFACLYALSLGRGFYGSDGEVMFQTTAALARQHTFTLPPDPGLPQIVPGAAGRYCGKYDPGLPLLGVPFFLAGDRLAQINHAHRTAVAAISVLGVPVLAGAGTLAALYVLARRLFGTRPALGIVLAAGLATPLWPYARMLYAESVLAGALAGTLALIVPRPAGGVRLVLAGACFGVGLLTRAALGIYALPLAVLAAGPDVRGDPRAALRRVVLFAAGMLPLIGVLAWHHTQCFGAPWRTGYAGEGFTTPPWEGITGLLISPARGVLFYAPPLAISLLLAPRGYRRCPALARTLFAGWGIALGFYGAWWAWGGGWTWGPRFLVPLIPLTCLPLGLLPGARRWRIALRTAAALGIAAQIVMIAVDVTPYYAARPAFDAGDSPLLWAVGRLADGLREPLALFHLRATGLPPAWTVGLPLLLITGGVVAGARILWAAASPSHLHKLNQSV